jgi:hypothetical protein
VEFTFFGMVGYPDINCTQVVIVSLMYIFLLPIQLLDMLFESRSGPVPVAGSKFGSKLEMVPDPINSVARDGTCLVRIRPSHGTGFDPVGANYFSTVAYKE